VNREKFIDGRLSGRRTNPYGREKGALASSLYSSMIKGKINDGEGTRGKKVPPSSFFQPFIAP